MKSEKHISKPKDLIDYEASMVKQKENIENKLVSLDQKLLMLQNKESIINSIINKLSVELETTDPKKFTAINQIRSTLNKQFETLGLIIDMIMKVEDTIQKYRKMIIDIENQKINNIIKVIKELNNDNTETDVSKLLLTINQQFNSDDSNPLIQDVKSELKELGY